MNEQKPRRFQKLWDATLIASVSSVIGTVMAGIAFFVFQQAYSAQNRINLHEMELNNLRDDLVTTQAMIAEELAPIKAWISDYGGDPLWKEDVDELRRQLQKQFHDHANTHKHQ